MKKILLSLIISAVIAFVASNLISRKSKFNWEMVLNYEHIQNSYDVEFAVLSKNLNLNALDMFNVFINKLDARISLMDSKNPCSQVRSSATQPNILVSLDIIGQLSVIVRSEDKQLLFKCEKYVDGQLDRFEEYNNDFIQEIISDMNIKSNDSNNYNNYKDVIKSSESIAEKESKLIREQGQLELMLGLTVKKIIENNTDKQLDVFSMKELSQALQVLAQINAMKAGSAGEMAKRRNGKYSKYPSPKDFNIIQKQGRTMVYKKDSTELLGFSIFVILQTIFLIYFFSNSIYARENEIKKKIYNFFN